MAEWFFEPGHTAAEFSVRHMMVTHVRGHFKNVHGRLVFDPQNPRASQVEVRIEAKSIWSGQPERAHFYRAETDRTLRSGLGYHCRKLAPLFDPCREREAWSRVLTELNHLIR